MPVLVKFTNTTSCPEQGFVIPDATSKNDGVMTRVQAAKLASLTAPGDLVWTEVSGFTNGWQNFGPPYFNVAFAKDALGFAHLRGVVEGGTFTEAAFTLPGGFRPSSSVILPATLLAASVGQPLVPTAGAVVVQVDAAGSVVIYPDPDVIVASTITTLDGVLFFVG